MYGAYNYNTSASDMQGGGGGFISGSPSHDGSPSTDSPSKKSRSGAVNQSLMPVTIKQLFGATQAHADDAFKVDNKELNQVTIVGLIAQITESTTNITFAIDDGTGKIEAKIWLDQEDQNDYNLQKRSAWKEGIYVRVVGHLRSFHNQRSIVAFRIQPVVDFNEITYHQLEAVYAHLSNTKGVLQAADAPTMTTALSGGGRADPGVYGSYNNFAKPNQSTQSFNDLHTQIIQVIRNARSAEGASVSLICQQLKRNEHEIRRAIDELSGGGHLFSTTDEDHYQITDPSML